MGRILNRFSKDVDITDIQILTSIRIFLIQFFRTIVALVIISLETPLILLAVIPLVLFYTFVQRIYIPTSRQLKRIDSTSRSLIYNHFSETVNGIASIRAFNACEEFVEELIRRVDANHKCYFSSFTAQRWLSFRLEVLGSAIVFISAIFAVVFRNSLSSGVAGLAITYAMSITAYLKALVTFASELETNIVSVERILEYTQIPTEV